MAKNNDCYFEGNIGADPKRFGKLVKFNLAVWRGKEKKDMWLSVICFGELGDHVESVFGKGDKVKVWGKLDINEYQGKETPQIIADRVEEKGDTRQDKDFPTEENDVPL